MKDLMSMIAPLSQNDRDRIREEELFRVVARKEILDKTPQDGALNFWKIVNSTFGLWLLSAIFVTGLGGGYKIYDEWSKAKQKIVDERRARDIATADRIERVSMEFSYRLSSAIIRLRDADLQMKKDPKLDPYALRLSALAPLSSPTNEQFRPLYAELKDYSGLALIAELKSLSSSLNLTGEPQLHRDLLIALSAVVSDAESVDMRAPNAFSLVAGRLLERSGYPRLANGFRFTACKNDLPFC